MSAGLTGSYWTKPPVGVEVEHKGKLYVTVDRTPKNGDMVWTGEYGVYPFKEANAAPPPWWINAHACLPLDLSADLVHTTETNTWGSSTSVPT